MKNQNAECQACKVRKAEFTVQKYGLKYDDNYDWGEAFEREFFAECKVERWRKRGKTYYQMTNKAGVVRNIDINHLENERIMRRELEALMGQTMPPLIGCFRDSISRRIVMTSPLRPDMQPLNNWRSLLD